MYLLVILFLQTFAYAGEPTPIQAASDIARGLQFVDSTNRGSPPAPVDCDLAELTGTRTSLKCDVPSPLPDPAKNVNFYVLTFDNYNKIPEALKKQLPPFTEDAKLKKIYVTIGMTNDSGLGLIGIKGDDQGFTTGFQYGLGGTYRDTIDFQGSVTGNLYTETIEGTKKTVDGTKVAEQKFRNETIFQIMANNAREGKLSYWDARVGLVHISSKENFGLLDGSYQQASFHKWMEEIKKGSNTQYTNINDGQKDTWGAYFGAMLGVQHQLKFGDNCIVRTYAAAGGQVSNLPSHTYAEGVAGVEARYNIGAGSIKAGIEASSKVHSQGVLNTVSARVAANYNEKYEGGVVFTSQNGTLMNGPLTYNLTNKKTLKIDRTVMGYVKVYFD